MLLRTKVRATALAQLCNAFTAAGCNVNASADRDMPAEAGAMPTVAIYVDDNKKDGTSSGAPLFTTHCMTTIELRVEGETLRTARALMERICDVVEQTLLGQGSFTVALVCAKGSAAFVQDASSKAELEPGLCLSGTGLPRGCWIDSIGDDGALALMTDRGPVSWALASGTNSFAVLPFRALFEANDSVDTFTDFIGAGSKNHVATATIEIRSHTHEVYEIPTPPPLTGIGLYIDAINVFDATADFSAANLEPFSVAAPPRTQGPDGRPEIVGSVDLSQT